MPDLKESREAKTQPLTFTLALLLTLIPSLYTTIKMLYLILENFLPVLKKTLKRKVCP